MRSIFQIQMIHQGSDLKILRMGRRISGVSVRPAFGSGNI